MKAHAALAALIVALATGAVALSAADATPLATVTISEVAGNGVTPFPTANLTAAQIAALVPSADWQTATVGGVSYSGPLLLTVLNDEGLTYLSCKNDELRYYIDVTDGAGTVVALTAGEIDTVFGGVGFGKNPAFLAVEAAGSPLGSPDLVVPGDVTTNRDLDDVTAISVGRATPQLYGNASAYGETVPGNSEASCTSFTPITAPTPGSVLINGDVADPTTLSPAQLAALPQMTQVDTYVSSSTKVKEEVGPTLYSAIEQAKPELQSSLVNKLRFYVEVTSYDDGYAATVSWSEIDPQLNDKQVLLSLAASSCSTTPPASVSSPSCPTPTPFTAAMPTGDLPTLTVPGDGAGGRYVSGVGVVSVFADLNGLNLSGMNLSGADLPGANIENANLQGSNLRGANLQGVDLAGADLVGANLSGADLAGADLQGADLQNVNLSGDELAGANLDGANLDGANLNGADLTGADLDDATVSGANLADVTWSNTTCPDGTNSASDGGTCVHDV